MSEETTTEAAPARRHALREKWPELLLEIASIVLAVSLAFAVDEWRDGHTRRREAGLLREAVVRELATNRQELERTVAGVRQLHQIATSVAAEVPSERHIQLGFELALLSRAAYGLMVASDASTELDLDWRLSVARTYELQTVVLARQERVVDAVGRWVTLAPGESPQPVARHLLGEVVVLEQLRDSLSQRFATMPSAPPLPD
jgi:hypothetical protein